MSPDDIQREYDRLGYRHGWTFLMTPEARLHDAKVCLVGLNPGGDHTGAGLWSCEQGNAYNVERWRAGPEGGRYSALQHQVHLLQGHLGLGPDDYLAAQFIPFRSRDWRGLANADEAIAYGRKVWAWLLAVSSAKLFLCLGEQAAREIGRLTGATAEEERYPSGWGAVSIGRSVGSEGRVINCIIGYLSACLQRGSRWRGGNAFP